MAGQRLPQCIYTALCMQCASESHLKTAMVFHLFFMELLHTQKKANFTLLERYVCTTENILANITEGHRSL